MQITQTLISPTNDTTFTIIKTWVTFTYYKPIIPKLTKLFRNTNLKIAFSTNNTIYNILHNRPHHTSTHAYSGIFQLKYQACKLSYIGQAGRRLQLRVKEHIRYVKSNKP